MKLKLKERRKIVNKTSSKVISMLTRFTTRNFKRHQANWIESLESRQIDFCCYEDWFFRCNTSLRYSEVLSVLWDRELFATISTMSTLISWVKFVDFVVRTSSRLCIDLIQTTKRNRNRQEEFKRVTRDFDHCIFCEIFCKIFFFEIRNLRIEFVYFVCFFLVAMSFVSELFRVLLVLDSLVATQSISLQESRLQTLRKDLWFKE